MNSQLNVPQWLSLSPTLRTTIASTFGLTRSQGSRVEDNKVVSDGYTQDDLAVLTVPAMQAYLLDTVEADFFTLFNRVVEILSVEERKEEITKLETNRQTLLIQWTKALEALRKESIEAHLEPEFTNLVRMFFGTETYEPKKETTTN